MAEKLLEEVDKLVENIEKMLLNFENTVRSGELEARYRELSDRLRLLVEMGFTGLRPALERAMLLTQYAHAIRVRLENRMVAYTGMLAREYRDFEKHTKFIHSRLREAASLLQLLSSASRNRA